MQPVLQSPAAPVKAVGFLVEHMQDQDWMPLTITNSRAGAAVPRNGPREIKERVHTSHIGAQLAKLEAAEVPTKPKVLSRDAVATIQNYRRQNNMTQRALDQQLAFPPNTINKFEARQLTPSGTQLNALNRVLKTGLTLE